MLTDRDVERIWFGCGNFGGIGSSPSLRSAGDSEEQALELLDHARRVGLRRFDTANTYGGGASEIVLGKWLRAQGAVLPPGRADRDQGRQSARLPARRDAAEPGQIAYPPRSIAPAPRRRADRPLLHPRIRPRDAAGRNARRHDARGRGGEDRPLRCLQRVAGRRGGGQEARRREPRLPLRICSERVQLPRDGGCRGADPLLRGAWAALHGVQPARRRLPHRQVSPGRAAAARQPRSPTRRRSAPAIRRSSPSPRSSG